MATKRSNESQSIVGLEGQHIPLGTDRIPAELPGMSELLGAYQAGLNNLSAQLPFESLSVGREPMSRD